jgi:hypothetical protein
MSGIPLKKLSSLFSPALFWDAANDAELHPEWLVARVVEMGTLDDFRNLLVLYGKEAVKEIVLKSARLSARELHFLSISFDVDKTQFVCYTKKPSRPKRLRYWNP